MTEHNYQLGKQYFSYSVLERVLRVVLRSALRQ
jgi:hypothetical protein